MTARLAALLAAAALVIGSGIYLLAAIPFFYAACGVVALFALLAAVGRDASPQ